VARRGGGPHAARPPHPHPPAPLTRARPGPAPQTEDTKRVPVLYTLLHQALEAALPVPGEEEGWEGDGGLTAGAAHLKRLMDRTQGARGGREEGAR